MDFYEVVRQAAALLQQQGKLTYRTLRRQFALDDETLEDLKDELLFSHPIADEDGRGLVWTGETRETPAPTSQPDQTPQPEPQPVVEQVQTIQEISSSVEPNTPDAERRQLTVMFVDLVGSTALSTALDPEDLREVIRDYQSTCTEVIQRYDGHVAQLLGDGLLVYFGYPQAHEDDAQRAVRTGLEIIVAIGALNTRLEQDKGVKLAVRLGIHTGLVVVGEMGGEGRQEQLALGETPNIASRIQGLAAPDTMVISDATYRLIQGYFDCDTLSEQVLRGVAEPVNVYQVLRESGAQSRLDVASTRGLTPLLGREFECTLLFERWEQAKAGQGQVVLLSGEAGIGKSRLVQVLKDHIEDESHIRWECRSSPYFTNSALYPVIDLIQRTLRWQQDDTPEQRLEKLTQNLNQYQLPLEESVPLFAALLSLPVPEDRYPPLNLTPQRQRQKTLEAILAITLELSEQQPVLFILEDLHWTDPTTLELLDLLIDQTPTASLYALLTCRPDYQPTWSHRSYLTEMTLNRLSRQQVGQLATEVSGGKTLPAEVLEQLVARTDGVPLYVEEMTKAVLESGVLKEMDERYDLTGAMGSLTIPATLQDSLMARLDRLVTAKAVAQYASVIGRQFSFELLRAVSGLNEAMLQHELRRLVEGELVYQRGVPPQATYLFKHALVQDAAYESLLRSTRQGYHRRIAEVLEERFRETADVPPELLAHHFTGAGLNEQAVDYWYQAGQRASGRSAHVEAIAHLTNGLELVRILSETPAHTQYELLLLTTLGPALMATKGYAAPEVEETYMRARALCQQAGETPQVFPVFFGLWIYYGVRAETRQAKELAEHLLHLAHRFQNPSLLLQAHHTLWMTLFSLGELDAVREHCEQGIALYTPSQHHADTYHYGGHDPGVCCRGFAARTLWLLGYPDQALQRNDEMLALAQELSHPLSLVQALGWAAWVHQFRREKHLIPERVEAVMRLATEHGFPYWQAQGQIMDGWIRTAQEQQEEGLEWMHQGLASLQASGSEMLRPWYLSLMADAYGQSGQVAEGLRTLVEALALVEKHEVRLWEAELYRLKGELLRQSSTDNVTEAESCFHRAISIAQNQSAKSWELRAATSLARLWQSQGRRDEARELLAPVYDWFTEGFDTADLIEAKALLDELGG